MPDYEITVRYNDEGALSARGAAEHVYSHLLADMFYRSLTIEVRNKKTGEAEVVELEADVENDESLMRFITLIGVAVKFMTEEQKRELEEWERKNVDGRGTSTSDWPGWEKIIDKPPMKFRKDIGIEA
jgi:predicted Rossmann fold nucleotide-binding protein DprA/Smf involved in DNA uptake